MNKLTLVLALGAGLALSTAAAPHALADAMSQPTPTIQTLGTPEMTAAQFNSLFQPVADAPVLDSPYQFLGAPVSGTVRSQVFQGTGAASGLYAYAYQLSVNNASDGTGTPLHVDSASWMFNATPVGADLLNQGKPAFAYAITDGSIGGLVPPMAAPGQSIQVPTALSWQPQGDVGVLRAQYVDPTTQSQPLGAGADSATFVVLSNQPFSQQFVNLQSSNPTTGNFASVYAATGGSIAPIPAPEPTTILAWVGMAGAGLLAHRVRARRAVA